MTSRTSTMLQETRTTGENGVESIPRFRLPHKTDVKSGRPKLHGRAFYESLGSPKVVLAPMVDQSEYAWRLLTRSYMPEGGSVTSSTPLLAYSPMFHSRLFCETEKYRTAHFEPVRAVSENQTSEERNGDHHTSCNPSVPPPHSLYLDGNPATDRPLIVQFCSNSPQDLLSAARQVTPYCDAIDLNLGCPQGIARKGHYGAFLQEDWALIHQLVSTLHHDLPIPVTAKIRILGTPERTLEYARMILRAGASILAVHGRRREQKGHLTGLAEWDMIRYLRENLPKETVLFANGNILGYEDVETCLQETGADAVMSAEGNLHDPTIFRISPEHDRMEDGYWRGKDGKGGYRMDAVLRRYLDIIYEHVLERAPPVRKPLVTASSLSLPQTAASTTSSYNITSLSANEVITDTAHKNESKLSKKRQRNRITSPNLIAMQPHLFNLLRPLLSRQTHIRDVLAKVRMGDMVAYERVLEMVEEATAMGLYAYEAGTDDGMEHNAKRAQATEEERRKRQEDKEETDPRDGQMVVDHEPNSDINVFPHTNSNDANNNNIPKDQESSAATIAHHKRPWWICQPYIRPLPAEAAAIGAVTASKSKNGKNKNKNKYESVSTDESRLSKKRSASAMEHDGTVDDKLVSNKSKNRAILIQLASEAEAEAEAEAVKGARQPEESAVIVVQGGNESENGNLNDKEVIETEIAGTEGENQGETRSVMRNDPVVMDTDVAAMLDTRNTDRDTDTNAGGGTVLGNCTSGTTATSDSATTGKEGVVYG